MICFLTEFDSHIHSLTFAALRDETKYLCVIVDGMVNINMLFLCMGQRDRWTLDHFITIFTVPYYVYHVIMVLCTLTGS